MSSMQYYDPAMMLHAPCYHDPNCPSLPLTLLHVFLISEGHMVEHFHLPNRLAIVSQLLLLVEIERRGAFVLPLKDTQVQEHSPMMQLHCLKYFLYLPLKNEPLHHLLFDREVLLAFTKPAIHQVVTFILLFVLHQQGLLSLETEPRVHSAH